jgi:hypothetical protein
MRPSEIDQLYLDEITASRYPVAMDDQPPLRIDITGVGEEPTAPEEVKPELVAPVVAPESPSMTAYDPTIRERLAEFLQAGFESFGMERFQARRQAQSLVGGPSSNLPLQLGVADIVPFLGTGLQTQEAGRMLEDAADFAQRGEYGEAAISAAVGALGLVPGAAGTVKAARQVGELANVAGDKAVQAITGNPQATAMGALEAAGQMSPVSRIAPGVKPQAVAPRSNIGFYSAVEETVANLPQTKGTGAQFLAQIGKTAGVKPEELKWTGLDEFLKGKKSVTKAEVQDYLAANRVDVQEVRLTGSRKFTNPDEALTYLASQKGMTVDDVIETYGYSDDYDYVVLANMMNSPTKFSRYTLPGGENYREILLTLPQRTDPFDPSKVQIYRNRMSQTQGSFTIKYGDNVVGPFSDEINISNDYSGLSDQEIMDVAKRMYERGNELSGIKPMSGAFKSTHFGEPNILAHMRVNDRVVDGKKTLFIEEIQSDWHQAGRKKGYAGEASKNAEAEFKQYSQELATKYNLNPDQNLSMYATMKGMQPEEVARYDQLQSAWVGSKGKVPDAPFKTSWHELSLKRAIQEASEKGYDQIALTTGKTQAERYDLSKQVDTLRAPYDNGEYVVSFIPKGSNEYEYLGRFTKDRLPEAVGKDLAEKIIANKDVQTMTYKGEDLAIGGEGMKGFYDNILPKSLEKLGKKFDAKVGKTEMDGVEVWQMDITPKMRESVTTKGQPLFQVGVGTGAAAGAAAMQDNEEQM